MNCQEKIALLQIFAQAIGWKGATGRG